MVGLMMLTGRIEKGIGGFYYVSVADAGGCCAAGNSIYECKAKGNFRNKKIKPLVGDIVDIEVINQEKYLGNIVHIHDRSSELIRPAVANIHQILLVFAATDPEPNRNLIDRFLVMMKRQGVDTILCINKCDLPGADETIQGICHDYGYLAGYDVLEISAARKIGIEQLREKLAGRITALAGPSGVGKSTLLNILVPEASMQTGEISSKIKRGRHTTRHSEVFHMSEECAGETGDDHATYIIDTPGFSSVYLEEINAEELELYFPEFQEHISDCRFTGCAHIHEKDCGVRHAFENGLIADSRYEHYKSFYDELRQARRY